MTRLEPGKPVEIRPGVVRLLAPNPSMMTGPGTNTYILGTRGAVVLDPGPNLPEHVDAIRRAAPGLEAVLVTHTHTDHSPAAAALRAGGIVHCGRAAPPGRHQDAEFLPDRELADGDCVEVADVALRVLHTPGHASNHLCFIREDDGLLFTGDHIINGSTVVIDPPDGDMAAYIESLERLKRSGVRCIAPGHGELIEEPVAAIDELIRHRLDREAKVLAALADNPGVTSIKLTAVVYAAVDTRLHPIAERSLLAHLEKLERDRRVERAGDRWSVIP